MKVAPKSSLVEIFNALGDKTRFKLLRLLKANNEICVSELAEEVGISTAGVSQQLKILEKAGLVSRQRMGQKICYQLSQSTKLNQKILDLIEE